MTATAAVLQIADEAAAADGADPLDEAARIALADGAADLIAEDDAFALIHDGDLSLVVRPTARGRGLERALGDLLACDVVERDRAFRLSALRKSRRARGLG